MLVFIYLILVFIYHMTLKLLGSHIFGMKMFKILSLCKQGSYECHNISRKSINH